MEKNTDKAEDSDAVQVRCVETAAGVLTVEIRTMSDEDLEQMGRATRRAPKRVH